MAYLTRKQIKGITYYYAEESERVDWKPRRKWQKYLGSSLFQVGKHHHKSMQLKKKMIWYPVFRLLTSKV